MLTVSSLFAILGFLPSRTATVSACDILLFLGFCLHLTLVRILPFTASAKGNTILQDALKIVFAYAHINDGINVLQ